MLFIAPAYLPFPYKVEYKQYNALVIHSSDGNSDVPKHPQTSGLYTSANSVLGSSNCCIKEESYIYLLLEGTGFAVLLCHCWFSSCKVSGSPVRTCERDRQSYKCFSLCNHTRSLWWDRSKDFRVPIDSIQACHYDLTQISIKDHKNQQLRKKICIN